MGGKLDQKITLDYNGIKEGQESPQPQNGLHYCWMFPNAND